MSRFQIILDELRNITTIDLAHKAANILEKTLWASIGIVGTLAAIAVSFVAVIRREQE